MEIQGIIKVILPAVGGVSQRTGNPWKKQTFVLQTEEQYQKMVPFDVFGDERIAQFNLQLGDRVKVFFDVEGHEYNGRWFAALRCFNITRPAEQQGTQQVTQQTVASEPTQVFEAVQTPPGITPRQQPQPQYAARAGNPAPPPAQDDLPF